MKISLITDEISADPETAMELGTEWGIHDFELRGYGTDRVPLLSGYQKDRLLEVLHQFDARVVAISPGLFKCAGPPTSLGTFPVECIDHELYQRRREGADRIKYQLEELLPLSIEFAAECGADRLVVFSFQRAGSSAKEPPAPVIEALQQANAAVERAGLKLALEVESGYWADTGEHAASLIRAIGHPSLGINWDPANAFEAGERPFPDGYSAVRPFVRHVHFKDARVGPEGQFEYAVEGQIDWEGQIAALAGDNYDGYISVEPHMRPKIRSMSLMVDRLRALIASATRGPSSPTSSRGSSASL